MDSLALHLLRLRYAMRIARFASFPTTRAGLFELKRVHDGVKVKAARRIGGDDDKGGGGDGEGESSTALAREVGDLVEGIHCHLIDESINSIRRVYHKLVLRLKATKPTPFSDIDSEDFDVDKSIEAALTDAAHSPHVAVRRPIGAAWESFWRNLNLKKRGSTLTVPNLSLESAAEALSRSINVTPPPSPKKLTPPRTGWRT